jgi:hypothetical protein
MNNVRQPEGEHELRLVPSPAEVGRARQFVRYVLQERQIAPGRIATAELLVSELVTNAVKMTGTIQPGPAVRRGRQSYSAHYLTITPGRGLPGYRSSGQLGAAAGGPAAAS